jgi:hypothetical protein
MEIYKLENVKAIIDDIENMGFYIEYKLQKTFEYYLIDLKPIYIINDIMLHYVYCHEEEILYNTIEKSDIKYKGKDKIKRLDYKLIEKINYYMRLTEKINYIIRKDHINKGELNARF